MGALGGAAKSLKGRKKQPQKQGTGRQVAQNVTGKSKEQSVSNRQNPPISFSSPVASSATNISESMGSSRASSPEAAALEIHRKTIKLRNLLKGSLVLDKMQEENRRRSSKKAKRAGAEEALEKNKVKGKFSLPIPGKAKVKSLWENIKDFFITVLWGWIAVRLVKFAPMLTEWLPRIGSFVDWIIDMGIGTLDNISTGIKAAYDAYDWTRDKVIEIFGGKDQASQDEFAAKFDNLMSTMNRVMNIVFALGIAAAAISMARGRGGPRPRGGPRRGPKNQFKRTRNRVRRFTKPNRPALDRLKRLKEARKERKIAEEALKRQRLLRKIRPTNIKRTTQAAIENTKRFFAGSKTGTKPKPSLLSRWGSSLKSGFDTTVEGGKWLGKKAWGATTWTSRKVWQGANWAVDMTKGGLKNLDDFGKNFSKNMDNIITGAVGKAKEWRKSLGEFGELLKDPNLLRKKVQQLLKGKMDSLVKNNSLFKTLKGFIDDPKTIKTGLKKFMDGLKTNKDMIKLKKGLEAAKKSTKGISGIDKLIAAILGVIDYTLFEESPINAILNATAALVGYTAGFAIGAPFGGFPGFITGMIGGYVGEELSKLLLTGFAKIPGLTDVPDPLAPLLGLTPRSLIRDPSKPFTEQQQKKQTAAFNAALGIKSAKAETSKETSTPTSTSITPVSTASAAVGPAPASPDAGREAIAGALGDFMKANKSEIGVTGSIWQWLPRHPRKDVRSGYASYHNINRAIDIGGWSPSSPEGGGADEQAPVIKAILKWNKEKGVNPVELIHGSPAYKDVGDYRKHPDVHHHHVHVAYHKGGEVLGKGERLAKLLGGEIVIDVDSAEHKPVKNMLLAINHASTYEGVVDAIRKFAPYDAMMPETIVAQSPVQSIMGDVSSDIASGGILPQVVGEAESHYDFLYKGTLS